MRVASFLGNGRIEIEEMPVPEPGADEVLVEVDSCALCGTDKFAYVHGSEVVPGHEISGRLAACGTEVDDLVPGAAGVVYLVDFCGRCFACRRGWTNMCLAKRRMYGFTAHGGYAEYLCVRAACFLPVGERTPLDLATSLLDLFGTSNHALRRAGIASPSNVVIVGCGPIGLGAVAVAAARAIPDIVAIDVSSYRLELAANLGAAAVAANDGDAVARALAYVEDGFEVVIEAAGLDETQTQALALAAPGGRVVFVAHNPNPLAVRTLQDLIQLEKVLLGSEYFPVSEFAGNRAMLEEGRLDAAPIITHRFELDAIGDAFEAFTSGMTGKVLVRPGVGR